MVACAAATTPPTGRCKKDDLKRRSRFNIKLLAPFRGTDLALRNTIFQIECRLLARRNGRKAPRAARRAAKEMILKELTFKLQDLNFIHGHRQRARTARRAVKKNHIRSWEYQIVVFGLHRWTIRPFCFVLVNPQLAFSGRRQKLINNYSFSSLSLCLPAFRPLFSSFFFFFFPPPARSARPLASRSPARGWA